MSKKLIAAAVILLIPLSVLIWRNQADDQAPNNKSGKPHLLEPQEIAYPKGRWEPRLDKSDSRIEKFLRENQGNAAAVIAISRILRDKNFLHQYKDDFQNDPIFALHFISAFPDAPELKDWLQVLLKNAPENAIGHYLQLVHQIDLDPTAVDQIAGLLKSTVAMSHYDDYSVAIESAARQFYRNYLELDQREALRLSTAKNFTPSISGFIDIHDFINKRLSKAPPEERISLGAAGFNLGTNLVATGELVSMAIGLGLEGIYYRVLSDSDEQTFNISPEDVLMQIDDDRALMQMMIRAGPPDFLNISDSNLEKFITIRETEGKIPSFIFLDDLR